MVGAILGNKNFGDQIKWHKPNLLLTNICFGGYHRKSLLE